MKRLTIAITLTALLTIACGGQQESKENNDVKADSLDMVLKGDSTFYGLACDGCTDTILVFLPLNNTSGDPDTFNILNATRRHRVLGRLRIGDNVAVVRNQKDSTVADYVIDMENLRSTWCYQVMPTLRERADMQGKTTKQKVANLPDSIQELLSIPREYCLQIKGDQTVFSKGSYRMPTDNEDNVVEYPIVKHYTQWFLYNGKLLLYETMLDSLNETVVASIDTVQLELMDRDTLILRFNDGLHHYYREKEKQE